MPVPVSRPGQNAERWQAGGSQSTTRQLRRPIPVRLASAVWHRLRRDEWSSPDTQERGAGWYDRVFSQPGTIYHVHYTKSPYYFIWTVIADRIPRSASILEIGCGTGQFASFLSDRGISGYVGFDFSEQAVASARQRCPGLEFYVADARNTELLDRTEYKLVVCTEVLEHIEADLSVVHRIRAGTRCLLTVPSFDYPSHVRYFSSISEVSDRYGSFFKEYEVDEFLKDASGDRYFLLDGVRGGSE